PAAPPPLSPDRRGPRLRCRAARRARRRHRRPPPSPPSSEGGVMPYFFVLLLSPIGVAIALYRRNPRRFLDGPTEDAPERLLRWAVGLLPPHRAGGGGAMLGELGHLDGRRQRLRFAAGCTGAALVMPPWGRAAAGLWAMVAITAASLTIWARQTFH